jgi:hypothetical protein
LLGHIANDAIAPSDTEYNHAGEIRYVHAALATNNAKFEIITPGIIGMIATRPIRAGEEITVTYGYGYWLSNNKLTETTTERDSYKKDAEQKSEQLKKGAKLQAYGFKSEALRMKLNNTTEPTTKAKNAIQMRSSFTIGENQISSSGRKAIYLQIIAPSGEILQSKANYVMNTENGQQAYSDKKDIDYNNQAIDLTIYYDLKGQEVGKGNFKVKIYCEGQLIGTDSFTLK